ncbi:MAG: dTDP-4-dehydrorhamnose 3,5-epimerase [Synechococcales cyanobacterium CRU_2_2]|nr:dTDP-4-dehydrorhamnose 3,5-epimerase [Synechococcales cyanobacterium CRU_2_2]
MLAIPTPLESVYLLEPKVFQDERGVFFESFSQQAFEHQVGNHYPSFVQDNHSISCRNVLRGLHYQVGKPQGKLVRAVVGKIFDVAVDLRQSSPSFGQWVGYELSADNHRQLWIPPGFAHGFLALSDRVEVLYKTTDYYYPAGDRALHWNDPDLAIDWPFIGDVILSQKDQAAPGLAQAERFA